MTNEEFQKLVLQELKALNQKVGNVETKQDEIYQVVRAIEHSNKVGKAELDSQNIRIAKVEGKLKKAAKALNQDVSVENASNL